MKEIERHTKKLLVEWIQSLVSEEEADKIDTKNVLEFIPKQVHYYANQRVSLSSYSLATFGLILDGASLTGGYGGPQTNAINLTATYDIINQQVAAPTDLSDDDAWVL